MTLGNLGQSSYACNSDQMLTTPGSRNGNIKLFCQYGTLNEVTEVMQTFVETQVTCQNEGVNFRSTVPECSYSENMRKEGIAQINSVFMKKCFGKVECDFPLDQVMFNSNCT